VMGEIALIVLCISIIVGGIALFRDMFNRRGW